MEKNLIVHFFENVETTKEYNGYFYKVTDAITIVLLRSICGLKNISQNHQWASSDRIKEFLKEKFQIKSVPCYYWLLCLMKLIKPDCFHAAGKQGKTYTFPGQKNNPFHRENGQL